MKREETIKKAEDFRQGVMSYRDLLLASRDSAMPHIVRNHDLIDEAKSKLVRTFASLEKYIFKFGNNPKMNDGVWNVLYSPYSMAFSSDILLRVGPAIDGVIDDLDIVLGRLESSTDVDFEEKINPLQKELIVKDNRWNYCNPFWLIWKLFKLIWKHKIISGIFLFIVVPLIVAYIQHKLGWNQ